MNAQSPKSLLSSPIRFTCQTYAWIQCGDKYNGKIDHMAKIASQAGFEGLEPINLQLGPYWDAALLRDTMDKFNLKLSSLTLACEWLQPQETDAERKEADRLIELARACGPDTVVMLVQMPGADRQNLAERQRNLMFNINNVAKRVADKGLIATYHPNSPDGSVWRVREDYDKLLPMLDSKFIKWTPDVGHIAKGGMDPVQLVRQYRELVNHFHFKDMDTSGEWALMGEGSIDFKTIVQDMVDTGYDGWIVFEDECEASIDDPDGVTLKDGVFIRDTVRSWLKSPQLV
jgi:inosose dehydratase